MYVTPTNREYRATLIRQGIAPRTILVTSSKAHIQRAARAWTQRVPPQRTCIRLSLCNASHIVLKQYRFRPRVRLAGGADTFPDHRAKFALLIADLSEQYPGLAIVLTSVEEAPQQRVTLHYTIDGTAFQMEQGHSITNDTMNATLLQQIEAHLCQTGAHPITLDKIAGETMTRVQCAEGDFAILEPGATVRHADKDPLDPIEWEEAS